MSKLGRCPTCGGVAIELDGREYLEQLARVRAEEAGLDPALVCALIEMESGWNPWAVRHEPGYRWVYPHKLAALDPAVPAEKKLIQEIMDEHGWPGTPETETTLQRFSLGPMQAMGATMRERGYNGWLPQLCDPEVNLEWGLKHLLWLADGRFGIMLPVDLAAAWNAGSPRRTATGNYVNQDYVDRFLAAMEKYKEGGG